jgi:hypothetical protein
MHRKGHTICNGRAHGEEDDEHRAQISSPHPDWNDLKDTGNTDGSTNSASQSSNCHSDDRNSHFVCGADDDHADDDNGGGGKGDISASDEVRYMTGERSNGRESQTVDQGEPRPDCEPSNIVVGVG